jgi:hypothetical protein
MMRLMGHGDEVGADLRGRQEPEGRKSMVILAAGKGSGRPTAGASTSADMVFHGKATGK